MHVYISIFDVELIVKLYHLHLFLHLYLIYHLAMLRSMMSGVPNSECSVLSLNCSLRAVNEVVKNLKPDNG